MAKQKAVNRGGRPRGAGVSTAVSSFKFEAEGLAAQLDEARRRFGLSRASYIRRAVWQAIHEDLKS